MENKIIILEQTVKEALSCILSHSNSDDSQITSSLAANIASISGLKTFPTVANKVLTLLNKDDFSIDEISDTIRKDPSLAAGILRLASSPFYAATHPITSLDTAFMRLGRNTVKETIFAVTTMQLFPDLTGLGSAIRDHCATVAAIAHALSGKFKIGNPEIMFLSGLMHDIGILLFIESKEVKYPPYEITYNKLSTQFNREELEQVQFDHAILGGQVLTRWKLGSPIPEVIAFHHLNISHWAQRKPSHLIALLKISDIIDVTLTESLEPQAIKDAEYKIAKELKFLNLRAEEIVDFLPTLIECRKEALSLFA